MRSESARVGFVIPYFFNPPKNGGQHAGFGFAKALSAHFRLSVVSTSDNQTADTLDLQADLPTNFSKYVNPGVAFNILRGLRAKGVKYLVFQQPFIGLLWGFVADYFQIPWGIYVQNIEYQRFKSMGKWYWPIIYLIECLVFHRAKNLFFIAPTDYEIGLRIFRFSPQKATIVHYGTHFEAPPTDRQSCRRKILDQLKLSTDQKLILFFGPQSYLPNYEAVVFLRDQILPHLLASPQNNIHLLIAGGGLGQKDQETIEQLGKMHYLGFVPDIALFVKGVDVVINPIFTGGGVKTKVIESIALGTTVLSSKSGALGVDQEACGHKLVVVEDDYINDYIQQLQTILEHPNTPTPESFYKTYIWKNAILPAIEIIQSQIKQ